MDTATISHENHGYYRHSTVVNVWQVEYTLVVPLSGVCRGVDPSMYLCCVDIVEVSIPANQPMKQSHTVGR